MLRCTTGCIYKWVAAPVGAAPVGAAPVGAASAGAATWLGVATVGCGTTGCGYNWVRLQLGEDKNIKDEYKIQE